MPRQGQVENEVVRNANEEPQTTDKLELQPLTQEELRELARILHEMLRRDLLLERNRMGR